MTKIQTLPLTGAATTIPNPTGRYPAVYQAVNIAQKGSAAL